MHVLINNRGWALDVLIAYVMENMFIPLALPNIVDCFVIVWLILNELICIKQNIGAIGVHILFVSPIMLLLKQKVEDTSIPDNGKDGN